MEQNERLSQTKCLIIYYCLQVRIIGEERWLVALESTIVYLYVCQTICLVLVKHSHVILRRQRTERLCPNFQVTNVK